MKTSVAVPGSLAMAPLIAGAATFSVNPVADTFVTPGSDGTLSISNYGGAGAISVAASGSARGEFQSVMRYDLSGAPGFFNATFGAGNWTIQSVSLQLTAQSPNNPVFNTAAASSLGVSWMQNDSWVEGTGTPASPAATGITYDTLATFLGPNDQSLGSLSYNGLTSGSLASSLTLSSGLLGDIQNGGLLSLRLFAADSSVSGVFPARTFGTPVSRPSITIDAVAVPEPSAFALGLLGLLCVFGRRWFRRS
jgi:hypothetical protein